jgi:hypothetical protein
VVPVTGHHQDKIIGITDEFPVALAMSSALSPLPVIAHILTPLPVEMLVQR